jgi:hypothetical protein
VRAQEFCAFLLTLTYIEVADPEMSIASENGFIRTFGDTALFGEIEIRWH